jgi:hypothetical protein
MTTDRSPDFPEMLLKKFANSIADGWMSGFGRIFFLAKRGRIGSAKAFNNAPKPMTTIDNPEGRMQSAPTGYGLARRKRYYY